MLIYLTPREILYMTDKIENEDGGWVGQEVDTFVLLRKMADRWLSVVRPLLANQVEPGELDAKQLALDLSEAELWLLRTKVSSLEGTPDDPKFGIRLLEKIYGGLLNPITEKGWLARHMDRPDSGDVGPLDVKALMSEWKEAEDAAQGRTEDSPESEAEDTGTGEGPIQDPSPGSRAQSEAPASQDLSITTGPSHQTD